MVTFTMNVNVLLLLCLSIPTTFAQTCNELGCAGVQQQDGIDFFNQDSQSMVPAQSFGECCAACSAKQGCAAFTFRSDQKVCYLKADGNNPVSNVNASSGNCDTIPQVPCLGEFTPCSGGSCSMGNCTNCKSGQYLCPSDQTTCVELKDYLTCPGLKGSHLDPTVNIEDRIAYMVEHTTLTEQINQLTNKAPSIDHLGLPSYNWLNDDQHGVGRTTEKATVLPNGAGLGATWSKDLIHQAGFVLGTEARGLHNYFLHNESNRGEKCNGCGITIYGPNLNLVRDPRWGRGQETYGEDPHLMARLTVEWITGAQNNSAGNSVGPDGSLLSGLCCKHFAAYDLEDQPTARQQFNANLSSQSMWETYMPAFEACIKEGKATHVMCSYNAVNGVPTCGNKGLLTEILRDQWNFDGFVVSDYDAWAEILTTHHYATDMEDAAAIGINAGLDQEGGGVLAIDELAAAVTDGKVTKETVQTAFSRLMRVRIRLGMLDPPTSVSYNRLNHTEAQSPAHMQVAKNVALASMTLLKNSQQTLPLNPARFMNKAKSIAMVGPQAMMAGILMGNYAESASSGNWGTSIYDAFAQRLGGNLSINYAQGCVEIACDKTDLFAQAAQVAAEADVVIVTLGLQFGDGQHADDGSKESEGHDRTAIELPGNQAALVAALRKATSKPIIAILVHGGTLALGATANQLDAIMSAWYPGIEGANAIADTIFGDSNPAGRTATTWYTNTSVLPSPGQMDETAEGGVTYRYVKNQDAVVYPFGYGLSYTTFSYSSFAATSKSIAPCDGVQVSVVVKNTGNVDGDEVVQVYAKLPDATVTTTQVRLVAFDRVYIKAGDEMTVTLTITPDSYAVVYNNADIYKDSRQIEKGNVQLFVGGGQPGWYKGSLSTTVAVTDTKPLASCTTGV
eukprot:m.196622 g.196622  ORF g.196622 m.196622 type:complete len:903 (+) comp32628_c0_seq1:29-2737(+)